MGWGEKPKPPPNFAKLFVNKMLKAPPPILAEGADASSWEFEGLSYDAQKGDTYKITIYQDQVTNDETVKYEKVQEAEEQPIEFYCTTGTHNDWGEDRMLEGDVSGLFYQEVEVPESGELEFRILAEGDQEKCIGPESTTSSKLSP